MVASANDVVAPGFDLAPKASTALLASSFESGMTSSRFSFEIMSYEFPKSSESSEYS